MTKSIITKSIITCPKCGVSEGEEILQMLASFFMNASLAKHF